MALSTYKYSKNASPVDVILTFMWIRRKSYFSMFATTFTLCTLYCLPLLGFVKSFMAVIDFRISNKQSRLC